MSCNVDWMIRYCSDFYGSDQFKVTSSLFSWRDLEEPRETGN
jgi:hypothetical protein